MQSMYSNPNQMAVAAAAAAAASAAAANGSGPQRLQYPGLPHQQPPQQQHGTGNIISASRMHGAGQNGKILQSITGCEPDDAMGQSTPAANGSRGVDPNESEMGSDVESENDDDDDDINNIDLEKLDTSHREMLEKLKRQQREERDEIERELNEAIAMTSSKLHNGNDMDFEKRSTGSLRSESESELPTQTEIKYQRPLGLLAQHGLSVKSGAAAKSIAGNSSGSHLMQMQMQQQQQQQEERQMLDQEDEKEYEMQDDESELIDKDKQLDRDIFREQDREKERLTDLDFSNHLSLMDRRFMPSPPPGTPPNHDPNKSSPPSGHHWTFEEQFKQLYEMSLEPKRKEFLDELFSFMQKRGTPVNRIPIMAKQTLDLYELFRLVVSKGGLVEVINKKLWREITKGLNLPSSITSAAFTLRTQYMKYLYPYECEKLKLSTLAELQSAIDGNRREGRRPGYGYDFSPIPTMLSTPPNPHMNGPLRPMLTGRPPTGLSPKDDEHPLLASTHNHLRSLAEHDARAMEAATRAMEEVTKRMEEASRAAIPMSKTMTSSSLGNTINTSTKYETPPCKRPAMFDEDRFMTHVGMHSTHIKMTSQSNGRLEYDNSMIVSMEINGMMYQGVLFAQHPRRI